MVKAADLSDRGHVGGRASGHAGNEVLDQVDLCGCPLSGRSVEDDVEAYGAVEDVSSVVTEIT